ncbi:MAG: NAD-dependent dehydratase, partial [Gammaproteobacteria bacterium]|nr:NAD-dependent dehydratase [Gammaproteobacteria bacterium]
MLERLLVTGAAGGVANLLRPRLVGVSKKFRLTDIRHFVSTSDSDETVIGDLADSAFVDQLVQGCDGILHLGGVSTEQP